MDIRCKYVIKLAINGMKNGNLVVLLRLTVCLLNNNDYYIIK
jgi:hypothetical protein